jgi:hypothetical protein
MTNTKKLRLSRVTVRALSPRVLDEVAGGTIIFVPPTSRCLTPLPSANNRCHFTVGPTCG